MRVLCRLFLWFKKFRLCPSLTSTRIIYRKIISTMANSSPPRKLKKFADSTGIADENDRDTEMQKALEQIDSCQNEIDAINEQVSEEILSIEQKYIKSREPYFKKRDEYISKIQNFWFTAFSNHPDLSTILDDNEEDCLHHLIKLNVEEFDDIRSGYRIDFYFDENPYFENTVLSKEFHLGSMENPTSQSTQIKWKEGYDLTQNNSEPRTSKTGRKRNLEQKSFFAWFNDHVDPCSDDIAEIIKDDLWLNPLQYYLIPDIEVENGVDEDDASELEDDVADTDIVQENDDADDTNKQNDDNSTI